MSELNRSTAPNVVILGNGIAGVSAALSLRQRRKDARITLVSGESDTFFSRTALMYIYMGHMRLADTQPHAPWFWREKRIERVQGWVSAVDTDARRLRFDDGRALAYDTLVLATGSVPNRFGWPGQDLPGVQGLYSLQDLERLERETPAVKDAVVVGGGLIGIELAEMLHSRGIGVTILSRESAYWDNALPQLEAEIVGEVIRAAGIGLRLSIGLRTVEAGLDGRASSVVTTTGERLSAQLVGLTAGVRPNLGALPGSNVPIARGVLVDRTLRTSIPGVWACGDCAEIRDPAAPNTPGVVETLWYTGRMQGERCGENIAAAWADTPPTPYTRGVPFNSAKFIDLEWHTYGDVGNATQTSPEDLVWVHRGRRHLMRLAVRDGRVVGVNALGLRQRQSTWTRWIEEGRTPSHVIDRLAEAHFDPELSRRFEREIAGALREQLR